MKIKKYFKRLLIKLLKNDPEIQELIREITNIEATAPAVQQSPVVKQAPASLDPLRQQLASELHLLALLKNDPELCDDWLGQLANTEGEQLLHLVAIAAQWERILHLWDFLASRCKREQRASTEEEQALLAGSIAIHNLIWRDKAACLYSAELNAAFDYEQHERATPKGDTVMEIWLFGLKNPAGKIQKNTLVQTR